jgi:hypothetical protein
MWEIYLGKLLDVRTVILLAVQREALKVAMMAEQLVAMWVALKVLNLAVSSDFEMVDYLVDE